MTFEMALAATRDTGRPYFSVAPTLNEGQSEGAVVAMLVPAWRFKDEDVEVHIYRGTFRRNFGHEAVLPPGDVPPDVRQLKYRPYDAGYWHLPLDREVQDVLREWGSPM